METPAVVGCVRVEDLRLQGQKMSRVRSEATSRRLLVIDDRSGSTA
jgi:hypothetical protein